MRPLRLLSIAIFAALAMQGADDGGAVPRVLRKSEPTDNVVVMLPGANRAPVASAALPMTEVRLLPPPADPDRPILRRPKHEYPAEFEQDSAEYIAQRIGAWQQPDAQVLLGDALRQRPAFADEQTVNGQIYAYLDPSGRHKELELDFDSETGLLRTVFVYPYNMTWQECRRTYGVNSEAAKANKGRTFYSYLDRHLDVLVDAGGKVISLGMY